MCKQGNTLSVYVKIPADLSCDGKEKWKVCGIDKCIAPIVKALQDAGIDMRGSCCGHGKREGTIALEDGRGLLIMSKKDYQKYVCKITSISSPIINSFLWEAKEKI